MAKSKGSMSQGHISKICNNSVLGGHINFIVGA